MNITDLTIKGQFYRKPTDSERELGHKLGDCRRQINILVEALEKYAVYAAETDEECPLRTIMSGIKAHVKDYVDLKNSRLMLTNLPFWKVVPANEAAVALETYKDKE